jgi:plasmid stability protein
MAQLLIPELDEGARERLDRRARRHGRSVEAEARTILEETLTEAGFEEPAAEGAAVLLSSEEKGLGDLMCERFKGRGLTDAEFARFNAGVDEINSRRAMGIPDFEADEFEEHPSDERSSSTPT